MLLLKLIEATQCINLCARRLSACPCFSYLSHGQPLKSDLFAYLLPISMHELTPLADDVTTVTTRHVTSSQRRVLSRCSIEQEWCV